MYCDESRIHLPEFKSYEHPYPAVTVGMLVPPGISALIRNVKLKAVVLRLCLARQLKKTADPTTAVFCVEHQGMLMSLTALHRNESLLIYETRRSDEGQLQL